MIKIVDYNPDWPLEFDRVASRLRDALGDDPLRIDHIGFPVPNGHIHGSILRIGKAASSSS